MIRLLYYAIAFLICSSKLTAGSDLLKDSKVTTIFVPYEASRISFPYPLHNNLRKVMVPIEMDSMAGLHLESKTKTAEAPLVNFFEGAYPVYYTLGHANGHFNGKISVLK